MGKWSLHKNKPGTSYSLKSALSLPGLSFQLWCKVLPLKGIGTTFTWINILSIVLRKSQDQLLVDIQLAGLGHVLLWHIKEINQHPVRLNIENFYHGIGDVLRQLSLLFNCPALKGSYSYYWRN